MKLKYTAPPRKPDDDGFARDRALIDWIFKIVGWIVLIGTLRYAADVTKSELLAAVSFYLSFNLAWLAYSFVDSRLSIEVVEERASVRRFRVLANLVVAAIVASVAYFGAGRAVSYAIVEVVEFHKRGEAQRSPYDRPDPIRGNKL